MRTIVNRLTRRGDPRTFALAVVVALLLMPPAEALAYFAATGSGTISGAKAGTPSGTVAINSDGIFTYSGPSTTALLPGGVVAFKVFALCQTTCPATVGSINLTAWTSDKPGCDTATMPNSFSMPAIVVNAAIPGPPQTQVGTANITWANLSGVNQNACSGATFTFTLSTP